MRNVEAEHLSRMLTNLSDSDPNKGIEGKGKTPTRSGPIAQARRDGFNVARNHLVQKLNDTGCKVSGLRHIDPNASKHQLKHETARFSKKPDGA